ncbi:hypothetical protein A2U01_0104520, partial [Trifolium medium]|nr:hypothetical protein [Trifolium medium]
MTSHPSSALNDMSGIEGKVWCPIGKTSNVDRLT